MFETLKGEDKGLQIDGKELKVFRFIADTILIAKQIDETRICLKLQQKSSYSIGVKNNMQKTLNVGNQL